VSTEELRAVAAEILDERRRTLGVLIPSEDASGESLDASAASTRA
jgi:hypothetical protein